MRKERKIVKMSHAQHREKESEVNDPVRIEEMSLAQGIKKNQN